MASSAAATATDDAALSSTTTTASPPSPLSSTPTPLCQECRQEPSLYQCPRCGRRTCSLQCCRAHKQRLKCNGKRCRTQFQRTEEMNDHTLKSDYFFLENVLQTLDGGKRLLKQVVGGGNNNGSRPPQPQQQVHLHLLQKKSDENDLTEEEKEMDNNEDDDTASKKRSRKTIPQERQQQFPPKVRKLLQHAKERNVTLLIMPPGMKRHDSNASQFHGPTQSLLWKVEFIVVKTPSQSSLVLPRISEESTVWQAWVTCISKPQKQKQAREQPVGIDSDDDHDDPVHFLLKKFPCPANRPVYVEVQRGATIRDALNGMTVIEHPTFHVVSLKDLDQYPMFVREVETPPRRGEM